MIRVLACLAFLLPAGLAAAGHYEIINPIQRVPGQLPPPPPQKPGSIRIVPRLDARQPCAQPAYPAKSREAGEEGAVDIGLEIDTDGHVSDSRILHSSGHSALDEAARAALAQCHYLPGESDGQPETLWLTIRYRWQAQP
jgi:TonB family protein